MLQDFYFSDLNLVDLGVDVTFCLICNDKKIYKNVITEQIECNYFFSRSTVLHVLIHDLKERKG